MSRRRVALALLGLGLLAILLYQIPAVNQRLAWRVDIARAALLGIVDPVSGVPTPELPPPQLFVTTQEATPLPPQASIVTLAPTATSRSLRARLDTPPVEYQTPNNCGPATLSLYLRFYGWEGDQDRIAEEIKPVAADRNVNIDELVYYAQNWAGWLSSMYRVGGDLEMLKAFVAEGIPVLIEKGEIIEIDYLFNDDHWAGHYALVTGYDEASRTFTYQDTFRGADHVMGYAELDEFWQQFNRAYMLVFLPSQEDIVRRILADNWDLDANRSQALQVAIAETQAQPDNAFTWFNLGQNQVYFEQYSQAAQSFDVARSLGLPQRMLRYQFGPFIAYYHTNQVETLHALVDYALRITDVSEEAMLWKGWAYFKEGDTGAAIAMFRQALETNPKSNEAQLALNFMGVDP